MRNWKNWLPPVLTVLMVGCLALLPLRLSVLRDGTLMGTVHAEELGEGSNFPARPPELPGRVWLLAKRDAWPDGLTIVDQRLEEAELDRALEQAQTELEELEAAGILPPAFAEIIDGVTGNRVYLRDQADLSSAGFLELNAYRKGTGEDVRLYLDGESGRILAISGWFPGEPLDPEAVGRAFLDRLGLAYETERVEPPSASAFFTLTESAAFYQVFRVGSFLQIAPRIDWQRVDKESGMLYEAMYGLVM